MENNKRRRQRRRKNKNKQNAVKDGNAFVWEYAHESLTERGTKFKRNYPEYD